MPEASTLLNVAFRQHPAFRTVQVNGARAVDAWLPVKDWSTPAVKEWHVDAPVP